MRTSAGTSVEETAINNATTTEEPKPRAYGAVKGLNTTAVSKTVWIM